MLLQLLGFPVFMFVSWASVQHTSWPPASVAAFVFVLTFGVFFPLRLLYTTLYTLARVGSTLLFLKMYLYFSMIGMEENNVDRMYTKPGLQAEKDLAHHK